jgi:hypothetical protein
MTNEERKISTEHFSKDHLPLYNKMALEAGWDPHNTRSWKPRQLKFGTDGMMIFPLPQIIEVPENEE